MVARNPRAVLARADRNVVRTRSNRAQRRAVRRKGEQHDALSPLSMRSIVVILYEF